MRVRFYMLVGLSSGYEWFQDWTTYREYYIPHRDTKYAGWSRFDSGSNPKRYYDTQTEYNRQAWPVPDASVLLKLGNVP
jgi:hypothetical protein